MRESDSTTQNSYQQFPYKIIRHLLRPKEGGVILVIQHQETEELRYLQAKEIFEEDWYFTQLSPEDLRTVAFYVYQQELRDEKAFMARTQELEIDVSVNK